MAEEIDKREAVVRIYVMMCSTKYKLITFSWFKRHRAPKESIYNVVRFLHKHTKVIEK